MGLSQQPLEPTVLGLQLLQALGVFGLHAAVLGPPLVKAGWAETVLPCKRRHRHAGVGLLDEPDDLLSGESALLHVRPRGLTDFTASPGTAQRGQVSISDASAAENGNTSFLQVENPIFSFPGFPYIRIIRLSAADFAHIKQGHAFDIGEDDAGRFQRSILNRTTSQDQFSQELSLMLNTGMVVPEPYGGNGLRLLVTVGGPIGTTPSGAPTPVVAIGLLPSGSPGVYSMVTAFPSGK